MQPTSASTTLGVKHLDHLNLTVNNLDETIAWYGRVFEFSPVERGTSNGIPYAIIKSGDAMLCIYERPELENLDRFERADRGFHGFGHFALRITDRPAWENRAASEGLELHYDGAVEWPHSTAWYVTDPTGYEIEVAFWHHDEVIF